MLLLRRRKDVGGNIGRRGGVERKRGGGGSGEGEEGDA